MAYDYSSYANSNFGGLDWLGLLGGIGSAILPSTGAWGIAKNVLGGIDAFMKNAAAARDNQGMYSGGASALLGTPYNPNASVADTAGVMSGAINDMTGGKGLTRFNIDDINAGGADALTMLRDNYGASSKAAVKMFNDVRNANSLYAKLGLNAAQGLENKVMSMMNNRYNRGMGYLDQLGIQQTADINTQYGNLANQTRQNMVGMGLGNSTATSNMLSGVERNRRADLSRLGESLAQMRLNTDASLSGDVINAATNFGNQQLGMQMDAYNKANQSSEDYATYAFNSGNAMRDTAANIVMGTRADARNALNSGAANALNLMQSPVVSYPDQGMLAQMSYNQGYANNPYSPPKQNLWSMLGFGGGAAAGAGIATLGSLALTPFLGPSPSLLMDAVGGGLVGGFGTQLMANRR